MKINELVENLRTHLETMSDEKIEAIDFDSLAKDLKEAAQALLNLDHKGELCDRLLADTKSEIKKMSLALSRAKGEDSTLSLTERLLDAEDLDYEGLVLLKHQVRAEFDKTFPGKPLHKIMQKSQSPDFRVSEFKIGEK